MTEIHAEASTCPACGAIRGGWGRSVESWRKASTFMLGVAAFFVLAGIAFGTWVASDSSTIWFDGMIAFLFLSPFMLFAGGVGLFRRYVIPRMQQGWHRQEPRSGSQPSARSAPRSASAPRRTNPCGSRRCGATSP
ncbi:zinc ribbon domain-containing protein [Paracoccus kondratievae]|uniref:zinc ribbon domain-containing protein n=1 Tax=Paracoccus kondratievae TaxID=135740 RepID=UPI001D0D5001|nr:zinc ribbon domain-containing protein [Paracoccus kondratievae]